MALFLWTGAKVEGTCLLTWTVWRIMRRQVPLAPALVLLSGYYLLLPSNDRTHPIRARNLGIPKNWRKSDERR